MATIGRPKTLQDGRTVTFYLDNDNVELLQHYTELRHLKLSESLREIVSKFLERNADTIAELEALHAENAQKIETVENKLVY